MNKRMFRNLVLAVLLLSLLVGTGAQANLYAAAQGPDPEASDPMAAAAAVGTAFTYQGQLNKDGSPVNGTCDMQFKLYDAASPSAQIGSTLTRTGVSVSGGLFTIPNLDFGDVFTGDARWLQVAVKCAGDAAYIALTPLQALTAAPYALSLRPGAQINGGVPTGLSVAATTTGVRGQGLNYGVLGVGVDTTGYSVGVRGESISNGGWGVAGVSTAISGTVYGVGGVAASPDGRGVYGTAPLYGVLGVGSTATGYNVGVRGESNSTSGWGVAGVANATSGTVYGVGGVAASPNGTAVYGSNAATSGKAYGVYGISASPSGQGVTGINNSATGTTYGVWGEVNSSAGRGVYGVNHATTGTSEGVYGSAYSPDGRGLLGINYAITGTAPGLYARSDSVDGIGVYGLADDATCDYANVNGVPCGGVSGESAEGFGVRGVSDSGVALGAYTLDGLALSLFSASSTGNFINATVGVMSPDTKFRVTKAGNVTADGTYTSPAADMAELLPAEAGLEPGDVLVIGLDGKLARSTQAYQPSVVGVYSTKPAFLGGSEIEEQSNAGKVPLAVVGIVPVKVSAENGSIQPGDLLVASGTAGHAMRCEGVDTCFGRTIGKALAGLDKGTGVIMMLVVLQ